MKTARPVNGIDVLGFIADEEVIKGYDGKKETLYSLAGSWMAKNNLYAPSSGAVDKFVELALARM